MHRPATLHFVLLSSLFFMMLASCSSAPQLASRWAHQEIVVDGIDNEWHESLNYVEKEKIGIGFANDSLTMYISVKAIDRETQLKIVRGGLTIWFDSTGGTKKIFGIHFPLGAAASGVVGTPTHIRGSKEAPDPTNDNTALEERFGKSLINLEIIGPGPLDRELLPLATSYSSHGIKAGLRDSLGTLFYELVLPLQSSPSRLLAIHARPGQSVGIGFVTDDFRRSQMARAPEEGAPNGGFGKPGMGGGTMSGGGAGGGRGGRGRGGDRLGASQEASTPIDFWAKVTIAQP